MKNIIKDYCENDKHENGLFLLDMPTGSGKTHFVLDFIVDYVKNDGPKRIFFITNYIKNLPIDELKERFLREGLTKRFDEVFLYIKSNVDSLLENFREDMTEKIRSCLPEKSSFNDALEIIRLIKNLEKNDSGTSKKAVEKFKDDLRLKYEPALRKDIRKALKNFKTIDRKLKEIKTKEKWSWVGELYPNIFTREKKIIFMTADKFLRYNDTLIENSYQFYNSAIIEKSIIFIDEVDATKDVMIKAIIEDKKRYDYIDMFRNIYGALESRHTHPTKIYAESTEWRSGAKRTLEAFTKNVYERSKEICEHYKLDYNFKVSDASVDDESFIFHDYTSLIIRKDGAYIHCNFDENQRINRITFEKEKQETTNNILKMFYELYGFTNYFKAFVRGMAWNYQINKVGDSISFESAVQTILDQFRFNEGDVKRSLTSEIILRSKNRKINDKDTFDQSFYNHGFRYYEFEDDERHDLNSRIMLTSYSTSPEKILSAICSVAKVIGMSATASIKTVTGNYDMTYLESVPDINIHKISSEESRTLKEYFENSVSKYKDEVEIVVKEFQKEEYSRESWNSVFEDPKYAEHVFEKLDLKIISNNKNFLCERYLKIAKVYREFVVHDDIKSMLCFLNKHPKFGDNELDLGILHEVFDFIISQNKKELSKESVVILDSDDFEAKKANIIDRLKKGDKLFVITTYQTLGAGQNIQYEVSDIEKYVKINDYPSRNVKDFDAIYVDKPTNIVPSIQKDDRITSLAEFIFYIEFLLQNGEISENVAHQAIKSAFKALNSVQIIRAQREIYDAPSTKLDAVRCVIQAIGRICRTNIKNKNIYIFADGELRSFFDRPIKAYGKLFNLEFEKLHECLYSKSHFEDKDIKKYEEHASLISKKTKNMINSILRREWDRRSIDIWHSLREFVLKNPTASDDVKHQLMYNCYIEQPKNSSKIYFKEDGDFESTEVSFKECHDMTRSVSMESARLKELLSIPNMEAHFNKNGYCTHFKDDKFIMSPPIFKNIYLGALGEVVGKEILNSIGIQLKELDENDFEKFDFKMNNGIFVDFKHWTGSSGVSYSDKIEELLQKMESVGASKLYVINILRADSEEKKVFKRQYDKHTIIEIPYLYDTEKMSWNDEALRELIREASIEQARCDQ